MWIMTLEDKFSKLQAKRLSEIEKERKSIEKNVKFLQEATKKPSLRKRRRHPIRLRRVLSIRRFKKFSKRARQKRTSSPKF